jgi:excisionase family DNA binding protein
LTTAEAADQLGVSRRTLVRWITAGRIKPALKMPGIRGPYLLDRQAVEQLVDELAQDREAS